MSAPFLGVRVMDGFGVDVGAGVAVDIVSAGDADVTTAAVAALLSIPGIGCPYN